MYYVPLQRIEEYMCDLCMYVFKFMYVCMYVCMYVYMSVFYVFLCSCSTLPEDLRGVNLEVALQVSNCFILFF